MSDSSEHVQAWIVHGQGLADQGRLDEAVAAFRQALQGQPDNIDAHYQLGHIFFRQGRYGEAVDRYQHVVQRNPQYPEAYFNLGVALQQLSRLDEAAHCYDQALRSDPNHLGAWINWGALRMAQRDFDGAIACYQQALGLKPDCDFAYVNLGNTWAGMGRVDEAIHCYEQAIACNPYCAEAYSNLGNALAGLGRPDEALASFQKAIHSRPSYAKAHTNLGNLLAELGRFGEAVAAHREAIRLNPEFFEAHNNLGNALASLGQVEEAAASYQQAIRLQPGSAQVHTNLGLVLARQRRWEEAEACHRQAILLDPRHAKAYTNLGSALADLNRFDEAVAAFQEAVRLNPDTEAYYNLGVTFLRKDLHEEAAACLLEALRLKPDYVVAHTSLGNLRVLQGRLEDAHASFQQALTIDPGCAEALNSLGLLLRSQGHMEQALACFEQTAHLLPDSAQAYHNQALVLVDLNRTDQAVQCLQHALQLDPGNARSHFQLGELYRDQGRMQEAAAHFDQALRLDPQNRLKMVDALLLPPIYDGPEEVTAWRNRLSEKVGALQAAKFVLDITDTNACYPFYLVYQGKNDRDLQQAIAGLHSAPSLPHVERGYKDGKIKVGFISRCLKEHTIGRLNCGVIAGLDRKAFSVTVLSVGSYRDNIASFLRQRADQYVEVPLHLPAARRIIAEQQLDILFYTDIGLDYATQTLAFSRLAPVQCVTWGHPVTTGIPNMDHFISSELLEESGAENHYTEALVRLKNLAVYYYRPAFTAPRKQPSAFGLPEGRHLYGCPQTLFKFHPDFDEILGNILRRDPLGVLFLIEGKYRHWEVLLRQRFARTLSDVQDRIFFLPMQKYTDFLDLLALADVLLDPLHFGGGNTSYEGLAAGVPIVTLPSSFLRGRITLALYRQMQMMDCVVQTPAEYAELAVRLGTDADYRAAVSGKILAQNDLLFENPAGIRDLEDFFQRAVAQERAER